MVFETTTDNWFELWETIKYNKCANYLRKLRVSDTYTIKQNTTYEKFIQYANTEYWELIESTRWVLATASSKSNDSTIPKAYADKIRTIVTDAIKQGGFSNRRANVGRIGGIGGGQNNNNEIRKQHKGDFNDFQNKGYKEVNYSEKQYKGNGQYQPQ